MQPCRHFARQNDDTVAMRRYRRILTAPRGSFFLSGARGVGKRTWARQTFPDAHIIDLADERRYQSFAANPALLGLELRTLPANQVVVLDEVQRVPALLKEVHRAIEGHSPAVRALGIERALAEDRRYEPARWARGAADDVSARAS
jgi:predicted AAA+ superfamily ATPase